MESIWGSQRELILAPAHTHTHESNVMQLLTLIDGPDDDTAHSNANVSNLLIELMNL